MVARLAWGALALVGCFSPALPSGVPCADPTAAARCPSGHVCVMRAGVEVCEPPGSPTDACGSCPDDARPDVQLSGDDTDGDTIDDAVDNCPAISNTDQANEDSDATGDVCDKCPPDPDTGADGDEDTVGDLCDPNPTAGGDALVAFLSFTAMPTGWTSQGTGTVMITSGDALLDGSAGGYAILATPSPGSANVEVRAAVTPEAIGGGFVGVITQHLSMTDTAIACQLAASDIRLYDSSSGGIINPVSFAVQTGTRYELRVRKRGTSFDCQASSPPTTSMGAATYNPANPEVGLRARSSRARYHWVMIISSP